MNVVRLVAALEVPTTYIPGTGFVASVGALVPYFTEQEPVVPFVTKTDSEEEQLPSIDHVSRLLPEGS